MVQEIYDAIFGHVTLSGLAAAVVFGAGVAFFEFRKLSKEIESIRDFQRDIASKVTELEQRLSESISSDR